MGINKDLGLPFGDGMQKVAICFDVDGTLLLDDAQQFVEYERVTHLLMTLKGMFKNAKIVVWSGGGRDYAETQARRLGIDDYVWRYYSKTQWQELQHLGYTILAIDDVQDTRLGVVNLIVRNK